MSELKPCPKCGPDGAPLRRIGEMDEYRVECVECYIVKTPWFKTPGEAEAYWNAFAEGMKLQAARIADLESAIRRCCRNCWANDATDLSGADQSHRVDAPLELRKRAMCGF